MLSIEGNPKFLQKYAVGGYRVEQALGEIGLLTIALNPTKGGEGSHLAAHADMQSLLGEEITCKIGEWTFVGTAESVDFDVSSGFEVTLRDGLYPLSLAGTSRVFADTDFGKIVKELADRQSVEFLGGCDSLPVKMAIQYQESNLAFLRRLAHQLGAQVWCGAGKIYVGTTAGADSGTLRLGLDMTSYSFHTELGMEKVSLGQHPYAKKNSSKNSNVQLSNGKYGSVQDAMVKLREKSQGDRAFHIVNEDSSFDDDKRFGESYLRAEASGRLLIRGTIGAPIPLGGKVKVSGANDDGETTVVRALSGYGDYSTQVHSWEVEVSNPDGLISNPAGSDGLHTSTALVTESSDDLNRVRVQFPWDDSRTATPWLRMASPYWGDGHTHYSPPEKGDMVLVMWGSVDMDPVVLGSIAAGQHVAMPNETMFFKTVEGQTLTVGEKAIVISNEADNKGAHIEMAPDEITVHTKDGQKIILGKGTIRIDQGKGNYIEISSSDIEMKSNNRITLDAKQISLKSMKVDVG